MSLPVPGEAWGDHEIISELGRGAFGRVFLARHLLIGRKVALKLIPVAGGDRDRESRERILREAQAVGKLNDPHVVALYSVRPPGATNAWVFEMEYVEGGSLSDLLGTPLPADEVIRHLHGIGCALRAAHQAGVVHGDLKPGNVLLTGTGDVKLADFGLARLVGEASLSADRADILAGTPSYMAPEVVMGRPPTPESDFWSLGVLAYRLLTARLPFDHRNLGTLFYAIENLPAPAIPASVNRKLARLVEGLLVKNPGQRAGIEEILGLLDGSALAAEATLPVAAAGPELRGRESEVKLFQEDLRRVAEASRGGTRILAGELGIGRSAMAGYALRAAAGFGLGRIEVRANPLEGLVRPLLEQLQERLSRWQPGFTESARLKSARDVVERLTEEPSVVRWESREQVYWAIEESLAGLIRDRGLLLVIEDAQHLFEDDVRLLRHLAGHLTGHGLMMLLTTSIQARDAEGAAVELPACLQVLAAEDGVVTTTLGPLAQEQIWQIVEDHLGLAGLSPEVGRHIVSTAEGNPLFALELARHLEQVGAVVREGGSLRPGEQWEAASLPRQFRDLVASRIGGFDESEREILDVAAVDGVDFDGRAIAVALDLPLLDVLRTLQRIYRAHGLVVPGERGFRFANAFTRDVIYEELAPALRAELHRKLAHHLDGSEGVDPLRLAIHWEESGEARRAAPCYLEAARACKRRFELLRTIEYARKGGIAPGAVDAELALRHAELVLALGVLYSDIGESGAAEQILVALVEAARTAQDKVLELRGRVVLAHIRLLSRGTGSLDLEILKRATRELPRITELARAHYLLALVYKYGGHLDEADTQIDRADSIFVELGQKSAHATALDMKASLRLRRGEEREAEEIYTEAARLARGAGMRLNAAISEINAANAAFGRGEFERTVPLLEKAIHTLEIEGSVQRAEHARVVLGEVYLAHGERELALACAERALEALRDGRYPLGLINALTLRAALRSATGDLGGAQADLQESEALAAKLRNQRVALRVRQRRAQVQVLTRRIEDATTTLGEALDLLGGVDDAGMHYEFAWAVLAAVLFGLPPEFAARAVARLPLRGPDLPELHARSQLLLDACAAWDQAEEPEQPEAAGKAREPEQLGRAAEAIRGWGDGPQRFEHLLLADLLEAETAWRSGGDRAPARRAAERAREFGHVWYELALRSRLPGSEPRIREILASLGPGLKGLVAMEELAAYWRKREDPGG